MEPTGRSLATVVWPRRRPSGTSQGTTAGAAGRKRPGYGGSQVAALAGMHRLATVVWARKMESSPPELRSSPNRTAVKPRAKP